MAYRDEMPEELINGKIVMLPYVSTNHAFVTGNILMIFMDYLHGKKEEVFSLGVAVYLRDKDCFVPDIAVVCDPEKIKEDGVHGAPDLVVEVLSPGTMCNDRGYKKEVYGRCGVREYWLVSPKEKAVEVYRLSGDELVLSDVYPTFLDWELDQLSEERRAAVEKSFRCSLFDDLDISLDDIFYRTS